MVLDKSSQDNFGHLNLGLGTEICPDELIREVQIEEKIYEHL